MIGCHLEGDYWIPDLIAPESPSIGIWGERRRQFLRNHRRPVYSSLLMTGKLNTHLQEVDQSASEMEERLTAQLAEREHVTEALKAEDQVAWVQAMNSIRNRVEEIVRRELVEVD